MSGFIHKSHHFHSFSKHFISTDTTVHLFYYAFHLCWNFFLEKFIFRALLVFFVIVEAFLNYKSCLVIWSGDYLSVLLCVVEKKIKMNITLYIRFLLTCWKKILIYKYLMALDSDHKMWFIKLQLQSKNIGCFQMVIINKMILAFHTKKSTCFYARLNILCLLFLFVKNYIFPRNKLMSMLRRLKSERKTD